VNIEKIKKMKSEYDELQKQFIIAEKGFEEKIEYIRKHQNRDDLDEEMNDKLDKLRKEVAARNGMISIGNKIESKKQRLRIASFAEIEKNQGDRKINLLELLKILV